MQFNIFNALQVVVNALIQASPAIFNVFNVFQVVVNALIQAIPAIFNVLLVCLVFWLIFAILGVNLFDGKFNNCVDRVTGSRDDNDDVTRNKSECLSANMTWQKELINFDNVLSAYVALFQVVSSIGAFILGNKFTQCIM